MNKRDNALAYFKKLYAQANTPIQSPTTSREEHRQDGVHTQVARRKYKTKRLVY
jgi:hypothetical protein